MKLKQNLVIFTVLITFLVPQVTRAAASDRVVQAQIDALLARIDELMLIIEARKADESADNESAAEAPEYLDWFSFSVGRDSAKTAFGDEEALLIFETDGGTEELVLTLTCDEDTVLLGSNHICVEEFRTDDFTESGGVRTFAIPVYASTTKLSKARLEVSACRFNGCVKEEKITLELIPEKRLIDGVRITDRWEYDYEWDDELFHVQEVMVSVPADDLSYMKVGLDCDDIALFKDTDDIKRVSCNVERKLRRIHFGTEESDDYGNTYNVILQVFVAGGVYPQGSTDGQVTLEFRFVKRDNSVELLEYAPTLWEEVDEEVDE